MRRRSGSRDCVRGGSGVGLRGQRWTIVSTKQQKTSEKEQLLQCAHRAEGSKVGGKGKPFAHEGIENSHWGLVLEHWLSPPPQALVNLQHFGRL